MTPDLIFFGIKSLIRLGQQGRRALIEYAADKPLEFPDIKRIRLAEPQDAINRILALPRYAPLTLAEPFSRLWEPSAGGHLMNDRWIRLSQADQAANLLLVIDAARGDAEALALLNDDDDDDDDGGEPIDADLLSGMVVVEQWKPGNKPVSPLGRMVLAIVGVAVDYVAVSPGLLDPGRNGDRLIRAFALTLGGPLAKKLDASGLGGSSALLDGLLKACASAGFDVLAARSGIPLSEFHLATLLDRMIAPLVDAADSEDALFNIRLQRALDSFAAPVAASAMRSIAGTTGALLGAEKSGVAGQIAAGALLDAARHNAVRAAFGDDGMLRILETTLAVGAARPDLFGGRDAGGSGIGIAGAFAAAFGERVEALAGAKTIDGRMLATEIACAAIGAVGRRAEMAAAWAGSTWEDAGKGLAAQVLSSLSEAATHPVHGTAFRQALPGAALVALARVVIDGLVASPPLFRNAGVIAHDLVDTVATMAGALAPHQRLAPDRDGWIEIARIMLAIGSRNPAAAGKSDPRFAACGEALVRIATSGRDGLFADSDIIAFARVLAAGLAEQPAAFAAETPDILVMASAIADAIAKDDIPLLTSHDWHQILEAAVEETTANPGRLFAAACNTANSPLAANMLGVVIRGIGARATPSSSGNSGFVAQPAQIRAATIAVIRATSGAPEKARRYAGLVREAVAAATAFVAANPGRYGGRDWLRLIDILTSRVLAGRYDDRLSETAATSKTLIPDAATADALLSGGR